MPTLNNNNSTGVQDEGIVDFYRGANVFITGGTGFMGKVLVEKLLRSCEGIGTIYLLVRPREGQNAAQRTDALFEDGVFQRLPKERPEYRQHVVAVEGDCTLPDLGLSAEVRAMLVENVNIVFHVAASVRFDEPVDVAVNINVLGTKRVMDLAKKAKNLKVAMHVSTAYSHCNQKLTEERLYDLPLDCDRVMKLVEASDASLIKAIEPTLIGTYPNTYTFTKAVAENYIKNHCKNLPVGVFRPAIVVNTAQEPISGWNDNMYGPGGILMACGAGLQRVLHINMNIRAMIVPCDMACNALIATAWDAASLSPAKETPVYNYAMHKDNSVSWGSFVGQVKTIGESMPTSQAIWYPSFMSTKHFYVYFLLTGLLHFLPALFVDLTCIIIGSKFRLTKLYKKVFTMSLVLGYFVNVEIDLTDERMWGLWRRLSKQDQSLFFFDIASLDWTRYFYAYVRGVRAYLFKESPDTIPQALKKHYRLYWLNEVAKAVLMLLLLRLTWALWTLCFGAIAGAPEASLSSVLEHTLVAGVQG